VRPGGFIKVDRIRRMGDNRRQKQKQYANSL